MPARSAYSAAKAAIRGLTQRHRPRAAVLDRCRPLGQRRQFTEAPAFDQPQRELTEAGAKHLLHSLVRQYTRYRQGLGQFIGLRAPTAPECKLSDMAQQGRDEDLFLASRHQVTGQIARLHGRMEGARQQLQQLVPRRAIEQPVDQADRQADQTDVVEADQHNRPGDRLDHFLRGVVVAAIGHSQHLGSQRRIAQQHVGELLHRCVLGLGQALEVRHDRGKRRQLGLVEALDPRLQTLGMYGQEMPPCRDGGAMKSPAVCPRSPRFFQHGQAVTVPTRKA